MVFFSSTVLVRACLYGAGLTLYNVCSTVGVFSTVGGYHEYRGDILSTVGYIMINVGDILSTVGVFSTMGDIMSTMGGYLEYRGECSVSWGIA